MGLFSNHGKGKRSHPFFHKTARSSTRSTNAAAKTDRPQHTTSLLFIKQYDILTIFREVLMPQNQN